MQLTISIDCSNPVFELDPEELPRILHDLAERVPQPVAPTNGALNIHDANGNHVGLASIE